MGNGRAILAVVFLAVGALLSQPIWRQAEATPLGPNRVFAGGVGFGGAGPAGRVIARIRTWC